MGKTLYRLALVSIVTALPILCGTPTLGSTASRYLSPVAPEHYYDVKRFVQARQGNLSEADAKRLTRTILNEARRASLDPRLIVGLIHVESSGNPMAKSKVGALGLMQLRPDTARAMARDLGLEWTGSESLYDANLNVVLGVRYLNRLIHRFGDIDIALAAYNWGPTRIARVIRRGRAIPLGYTQSVIGASTAMI